MKKSKIIVPALGLLLLSTAASVSGTVAWFTSNRTFNTEAGNFAVVKTSTDLVCQMTGGTGTRLNAGSLANDTKDDTIEIDNTAATASVNGVAYELTDASFDHTTGKVIAPDGDGTKVGSLKDYTAGSELERGSYETTGTDVKNTTHHIYSAFTWEMDFKVEYSAAAGNSALLFDLSKTSFVSSTNEALTEAGKGFRLAFIPLGAPANAASGNTYLTGETRVLARAQTTGITYIGNAAVGKTFAADSGETGGDTTQATAYSGLTLIDANTSFTLPADNSTTAAALGNASTGTPAYLGKFVAAPDTIVHLRFAVVAWFEGTDATVVNASALAEQVKAKLAFELRSVTD